MIEVKSYCDLPYDLIEIKRYAKIYNSTEFDGLISECIKEIDGKLNCRVCYEILPIVITENEVDFSKFKVISSGLAANLKGSNFAVVFASTIGIEIDRIINKYSKISPVKALVFDAIGAERIEALCNAFNSDIKREYKTSKPRFSAGYGDFPLLSQKDIFSALNCYKNIGLTLNDSLMMSPSKSVTAIIGI